MGVKDVSKGSWKSKRGYEVVYRRKKELSRKAET